MSFCTFSKEYAENNYTQIENKFLTKYMPEADGFYVKVYLYGLFLCQNTSSEFSAASMAEVLKTDEQRIKNAFYFWESCDLVEILSEDPLVVTYLPVRSATGRPTRINYARYADFNKELLRKMNAVGKDVGYAQSVKYMQFLDENELQPQALLLIVEYCIAKQGTAVSPSYIFNKAKKFIREGLFTYEQVERALSSYNAHEKELTALFIAMKLSFSPSESDYALFARWTDEYGFTFSAVSAAAHRLKKGTMNALDAILSEAYSRGKIEENELTAYLADRETFTAAVYKIARKLGAKIENPAAYVDEYVEKWFDCGYDGESLYDLAGYCFKCNLTDFSSMNTLVNDLFAKGVVARESVKEFLKTKNDDLKLFEKLRSACGGLKKTTATLSMIETWKSWNFTPEMIEEAAKRAASSAAPVPYINKILSEWKRKNVFTIEETQKEIAISATTSAANKFISPSVQAADDRSARERFYAALREKAISIAEKNRAAAETLPEFSQTEKALAQTEIDLAKAEVFRQEQLPSLQERKRVLTQKRKALLQTIGLTEEALSPQFACKKCSDSGFLKNGVACDCYKAATQNDNA